MVTRSSHRRHDRATCPGWAMPMVSLTDTSNAPMSTRAAQTVATRSGGTWPSNGHVGMRSKRRREPGCLIPPPLTNHAIADERRFDRLIDVLEAEGVGGRRKYRNLGDAGGLSPLEAGEVRHECR